MKVHKRYFIITLLVMWMMGLALPLPSMALDIPSSLDTATDGLLLHIDCEGNIEDQSERNNPT